MSQLTVIDIPQALRRRRGTASKQATFKELGVARATYDMWERGAVIPDDSYAELLSHWLGEPIETVVWSLYQARRVRSRDMGVYHGSLLAAAA